MTKSHATHRRGFVAAAIAAVGLTSFGIVGQASAEHIRTSAVRPTLTIRGQVNVNVAPVGFWARVGNGYEWRYRNTTRPVYDHRYYRIDRNRNGIIEQYERDFMTFDQDRDGVLDPSERKGYWMRQAVMNRYGQMTRQEMDRFAQLAYIFDRNDDGRLLASEREGMDTLIVTLRRFEALDRNGDHYLSRPEIARNRTMMIRFHELDLNGDHLVSRQEVRDSILTAFRTGTSMHADQYCSL